MVGSPRIQPPPVQSRRNSDLSYPRSHGELVMARNPQVDHPSNNDIAVARRDLHAIPTSIQHVRRSHATTRSHEAVENDVADVGEGLHEEFHEGAREWCGVGALPT